jgi:hypothetical protein
VIDVVEVQTQDRARDGGRVRRKIVARVPPLIDDDAEQREHAPNEKATDGEEYAAKGSYEIGIEPRAAAVTLSS